MGSERKYRATSSEMKTWDARGKWAQRWRDGFKEQTKHAIVENCEVSGKCTFAVMKRFDSYLQYCKWDKVRECVRGKRIWIVRWSRRERLSREDGNKKELEWWDCEWELGPRYTSVEPVEIGSVVNSTCLLSTRWVTRGLRHSYAQIEVIIIYCTVSCYKCIYT